MSDDLFEYLLRLGDDALIAAQRLGEWCAHAPEMEEDVALANIALDQLGAARLLLSYAGERAAGTGPNSTGPSGAGPNSAGQHSAGPLSEDDLAFLRDDREFRNCLLAELPNGFAGGPPDFGVTIAKLLFLSAYQRLLYDRLAGAGGLRINGAAANGAAPGRPGDERLAGIAAKARKESAYHFDHSAQWSIRLGDGTDESHRRMQSAVDEVWPYTHELFTDDELTRRLAGAGIAVNPSELREPWLALVEPVLAEATLTRPADGGWAPAGGRTGVHTEHLSYLLAEMQALHRAHPGVAW